MQQTRLNLLLTSFNNQCRKFVANPWRKLSFVIISWIVGFGLPTLLTSSISQGGTWDASVAFVFLIFTEIVNKIVYGTNESIQKPWWKDILSSFKIGFVYGLYLDATILTS